MLTNSITNAHENLERRWNQTLSTSSLEWNELFAICFNTILDNNLIWFQYRFVYRILRIQSKRHQMGQTENGLCRMCNNSEETIKHLFVECTYVAQMWSELKAYMESTNVEVVEPSPISILFDTGIGNCKRISHNII